MKSFMIGRVVESELREITLKRTGERRNICALGILSGRTCNAFDIFEDDKVFNKVVELQEGDLVIAVTSMQFDENTGKYRLFLNDIGECSEDLRDELLAVFRSRTV